MSTIMGKLITELAIYNSCLRDPTLDRADHIYWRQRIKETQNRITLYNKEHSHEN